MYKSKLLRFKNIIWDYVAENAPETDRRDLLSELEIIKQLKPHPHVIKLLGCVTESGKFATKTMKETVFSLGISLATIFIGVYLLVVESTRWSYECIALTITSTYNNQSIQLLYPSENYGYHVFFFYRSPCTIRSLFNIASVYFLSRFLLRAFVSAHRICSIWRSAGIPEKEPWTE